MQQNECNKMNVAIGANANVLSDGKSLHIQGRRVAHVTQRKNYHWSPNSNTEDNFYPHSKWYENTQIDRSNIDVVGYMTLVLPLITVVCIGIFQESIVQNVYLTIIVSANELYIFS